MKILTDKQINKYLKYHKQGNKRQKNKAKARLTKDFKKTHEARLHTMLSKMLCIVNNLCEDVSE